MRTRASVPLATVRHPILKPLAGAVALMMLSASSATLSRADKRSEVQHAG
jgi:hypothetical protein